MQSSQLKTPTKHSIWNEKKFLFLFFSSVFVTAFEIAAIVEIHLLPHQIAFPFFLVIILGIGRETVKKGFKALLKFDFASINLLMLVAVFGAYSLGHYEEAAIVIVLYTLGEYLEGYGIRTSRSAFRELMETRPKTATLENGETKTIREIGIDEIIRIKPFDYIPLDGEIIKGSTWIDESAITGEPIPVTKKEHDSVYAGTYNKQGSILVRVTKLSRDSTLSKIVELTFRANHSKAETQAFIDKFSSYYTPFVMFTAIGLTAIPTLVFNQPFEKWFIESLTLLVIACPCALVISTPVALFAAIGSASKKGIIIKGGRHLENIGKLKVMAMDKTRTLTYGKPVVHEVVQFGNHTKEDLLACAAGIEIHSEHPVAQSIVDEAKKRNLTLHDSENFESFAGKGAKADCVVCYNKHHCIGNLEFITEDHKVKQEVIEVVERIHNNGKTAILISDQKDVKGVIAVEDKIKPESRDTVRELNDLGVEVVMISGDHHLPASNVARELGINNFMSELLPEDKANAIKELIAKKEFVGMAGDGINDAPAMAWSTVGISMGAAGSDTAIEVSSIAILNDHLSNIPWLIKLGRRSIRLIHANVFMAIFTKMFIMILAFFGMSNLVLAIFADVGVTILVIINSLRLLKHK